MAKIKSIAGLMVVFAALMLLVPTTSVVNAEETEEAKKVVGDSYPLDYCLVTGEKLGSMGDPVSIDFNGRDIKFCCGGCIDEFKTNSVKYLAKLDSAIVKQQTAYYPLETCIVSGEKFGGSMGDPIEYVYNNRLVRLCCKMCKKTFAKDPASYFGKLDQAVIDAQLAEYPLKTCVISGGELGGMGEPINLVHGNRLVRFCCGGCVGAFRENPTAGLAKIDAALAPVKKVNKGNGDS